MNELMKNASILGIISCVATVFKTKFTAKHSSMKLTELFKRLVLVPDFGVIVPKPLFVRAARWM